MIEGGSGRGGSGGIEPVKLAKRADKEMQREKMIGVGVEYAPTLYTVLLSVEDDQRMSGYYPTLAGEVETYLTGRASQSGLVFDCPPLVRFMVDEGLKRGRFDIIAESVSADIIEDLRREERVHYGLEKGPQQGQPAAQAAPSASSKDQEDTFDPFVPSDMQSVPYKPTDAPVQAEAQPQNPEPAEPAEPAPAPAQPAAPEPAPVQPAQPVSQAAVAAAAAGAAAAASAPQSVPARQPQETPPAQPAPAQQQEAPQTEEAAAKTQLLGGTPARVPHAALVDYDSNMSYPIETAEAVIGRERSCDVVIANPSVSRQHARITRAAQGWLITDLDSLNGTAVNSQIISETYIHNGDTITLGNARLFFQED
ncbi:MAG: FHA domain-containing protein [Coriobacteriaceae bacterium]|nr:FHA domain-containing protein [Coriobacteriaceae bacterium]